MTNLTVLIINSIWFVYIIENNNWTTKADNEKIADGIWSEKWDDAERIFQWKFSSSGIISLSLFLSFPL